MVDFISAFQLIKNILGKFHALLGRFYRDKNLEQNLLNELENLTNSLTKIRESLSEKGEGHILENAISLTNLRCPFYHANKNNLDRLPPDITTTIASCNENINALIQLLEQYNSLHDSLIRLMIEGGLSITNISTIDFRKDLQTRDKIRNNFNQITRIESQINEQLGSCIKACDDIKTMDV